MAYIIPDVEHLRGKKVHWAIPLELRFWLYVNRDGPIHPIHGRCWTWTGIIEQTGYGSIKSKGLKLRAHRVSYELLVGDIPEGLCILHRCDNRTCVNPKHLFVGTNIDNVDDMIAKKRHGIGERNGRAILTEEDVQWIRKNYKKRHKVYGCKVMAKKLKVSEVVISLVIARKIWKHVPDL